MCYKSNYLKAISVAQTSAVAAAMHKSWVWYPGKVLTWGALNIFIPHTILDYRPTFCFQSSTQKPPIYTNKKGGGVNLLKLAK